ncbi:hydroxymethylglutaryl-CoA synthase [Flavobacterium branchiophilum NBRC 15030 = ATCC 35035]|uniref:Hydroxymethylglutaryl-CoA synthase n=1 Tax=Flavobacterium branchiophilum TaxID=55197 RepID=A0A543G7J1_9FLAO|nr:hydroxymethylglutaryl-CoA synthase [Flavobacterium branchiophilum]OXA69917.1 hydroxymethylglutaryl-CoA synthase [Flavobacterium branchiophilum NBRC 15030 = ATCC 35035]TQM42053.1 hydroxymethylglutaryl-CoA synthase [Flavobacterium branchiophilum]GEM53824.1 hydroxymethylglutaryl-CoA synthase [Flavobacterium branchiophilum NBRC 15030 = ATCC 35035]
MNVGIDSISFDIPQLFLPIKTLAENRNIEPDKLIKGLGLTKMSFPDVYQDVVTFASNAVWKLIDKEQINPNEIDRIYVGSESGVDSSKPIASYLISNLESKLGIGVFKNCDVVDMTFACIGAFDALQNTLDYIRLHPDKKAIVVATDNAKYDLNSTGEYTQGAGSIAMLITSNPRILKFESVVGVATQGVFDFFKPRRIISKNEITNQSDNPEWFGVLEQEVAIYKEQPVFDGLYSNTCYIQRITEAYFNYKQKSGQNGPIYQNWTNVLMHLPYAFQGRRTFVEIFVQENPNVLLNPNDLTYKEDIKGIAKSEDYLNFVNDKIRPSEIASGQIGNIYTGSIFLGMLSTLCYHFKENNDIINHKMGFIAYGSGSKSKVMEAQVMPQWQSVLQDIQLFETLDQCHEIDFETYTVLHKKERKEAVIAPINEFVLDRIEKENPVLVGARYYKFID